MKLFPIVCVLALGLLLGAHLSSQAGAADVARRDVEAALADFHRAKAEADGEAYFARLAPDAIVLGTAPGERWDTEQLRALLEPAFAQGRSQVSKPLETNVYLSDDLRTAWFDERLERSKIGEMRGTGVLRLRDGGWQVVQYNISLPVPNEVVGDVVKLVRHARKK